MDIRRLEESETIEEELKIGDLPDQALVYRLDRDKSNQNISASFEGNRLTVTIPESEAFEWTTTDKVGIEGSQTLADGSKLAILIEKDFACLTARAGDDEKDSFPHPGAAKSC